MKILSRDDATKRAKESFSRNLNLPIKDNDIRDDVSGLYFLLGIDRMAGRKLMQQAREEFAFSRVKVEEERLRLEENRLQTWEPSAREFFEKNLEVLGE